VTEIKRLEAYIRDAEARLNALYKSNYEAELALTEMKKQFYEANARVMQYEVSGENAAANSWGLANKYKLELCDIRHRMRVASPLVIAGMKHYHPLVSSVCRAVMKSVRLLPEEEMNVLYEGFHLLIQLFPS